MKSLVLGILMAASVGAFATDADTDADTDASMDRTPVVATLEGGYLGIDMIALLADGRLQLVSQGKKVQTADLPELVKKELLVLASQLAGVKVKKVEREDICRPMRPPGGMPRQQWSNLSISGYNQTSGTFNSVLRMILTRRACYMKTEYFPEVESTERAAEKFRAQLVILTLNYIK